MEEGTYRASTIPDLATADRALLGESATPAACQTREDTERDSYSSHRASKSFPLVDKVKFQSSTRVYTKAKQKDSGVDRGYVPTSSKSLFPSFGGDDEDMLSVSRNRNAVLSRNIEDSLGQTYKPGYAIESETNGLLKSGENKQHARKTHRANQSREGDQSNQPWEDRGHKTPVHPADHKSTRSVRGEEKKEIHTDLDRIDDEEIFSDMIRQTLQRNRKSLLPSGTSNPRHQHATGTPLVSLLGPSAFSSSVCPPSAAWASQTSLACSTLAESSGIYDVPKSSSDWRRAMSLLSLSAIGSGVLSPDIEKKEDYIDMTLGRRSGSVPDLDRLGCHGALDRSDDRGEGDYYLVPSNKHAYINVKYPSGHHKTLENVSGLKRRENRETRTSKDPDQDEQFQYRAKKRGSRQADGMRRWSSSEQKTHELASFSPATTSFREQKEQSPGPKDNRYQSARRSVKLSPAPRVKLPRGNQQAAASQRQENQWGRNGAGGLSTPSGDTPVTEQNPDTSEDSPTYVKMERTPETVETVLSFDEIVGELGKHFDETGSGTKVGVLPQTESSRRRRLSSVKRSPSYSRAVFAREDIGPCDGRNTANDTHTSGTEVRGFATDQNTPYNPSLGTYKRGGADAEIINNNNAGEPADPASACARRSLSLTGEDGDSEVSAGLERSPDPNKGSREAAQTTVSQKAFNLSNAATNKKDVTMNPSIFRRSSHPTPADKDDVIEPIYDHRIPPSCLEPRGIEDAVDCTYDSPRGYDRPHACRDTQSNGEQYTLFPSYLNEYVIIPTPSSSWSSASSSAKESAC